jgi:hypothetical protein
LLEALELCLVDVDAHHILAGLGEASACNQSDVPSTNNYDFHSPHVALSRAAV